MIVKAELFDIFSILGTTQIAQKSLMKPLACPFLNPSATQGFHMRTLPAQELSLAAIDSALC